MLLDPLETVFSHHGKQLMTNKMVSEIPSCRDRTSSTSKYDIIRSLCRKRHSRAQTMYVHTMTTFPPRFYYYLNLQGGKSNKRGGAPLLMVCRDTQRCRVVLEVRSRCLCVSTLVCLRIQTIFLVGCWQCVCVCLVSLRSLLVVTLL
jgi:hypothetical protein